MKLAYCYRYGILGGVCTQLINRLCYFATRPDLEVHLFFAQDHGISRTLADVPNVSFEPDMRRFRATVCGGGFDAVIVIDTEEFLHALAGADAVPPIITEVHTTTERGLQYLDQRDWRAAAFIVPSEYSRRMLSRRFDIGAAEPVHVAPNSIDRRLFFPCEVPERAARPIVLWVGKLDSHKNWRGFLDCAARITDEGADAEFWMVGGETAPERAAASLLDRADELDLMERFRWFDRVEYSTMRHLYSAVGESGGCMLVTSINESFGMAVLESLMCGCPVVSTNVGAIPEIAPQQPYVQLYAVDDVEAAARRVRSWVDGGEGPAVRAALLDDIDRLGETYSPATVGAEYIELIRSILAGVAAVA